MAQSVSSIAPPVTILRATGDVITDDYNTILRGLNRTTPDRNNDTRRVVSCFMSFRFPWNVLV